jgi:large subunit ribosomal protein L1
MDKKVVLEAIKAARESSPKRNFKQSLDLIINLKGLDLKKPDNQVEFFMTLKQARGRKTRVCALVGAELIDEARKVCDFSIVTDEFPKYAENKKLSKKLTEDYDYFIAQANIMPRIASTFGRVLGPRGKMPNPKAGCVVPPRFNLRPLYDRLQNTIRISARTIPIIQVMAGTEDLKDEQLAENILDVYDQVIHHLPGEKNNIASMYLKLTMGKPVRLTEKLTQEQVHEKKRLFHKKAEQKEEAKTEAVA